MELGLFYPGRGDTQLSSWNKCAYKELAAAKFGVNKRL